MKPIGNARFWPLASLGPWPRSRTRVSVNSVVCIRRCTEFVWFETVLTFYVQRFLSDTDTRGGDLSPRKQIKIVYYLLLSKISVCYCRSIGINKRSRASKRISYVIETIIERSHYRIHFPCTAPEIDEVKILWQRKIRLLITARAISRVIRHVQQDRGDSRAPHHTIAAPCTDANLTDFLTKQTRYIFLICYTSTSVAKCSQKAQEEVSKGCKGWASIRDDCPQTWRWGSLALNTPLPFKRQAERLC